LTAIDKEIALEQLHQSELEAQDIGYAHTAHLSVARVAQRLLKHVLRGKDAGR
jgi:hypothetical protein